MPCRCRQTDEAAPAARAARRAHCPSYAVVETRRLALTPPLLGVKPSTPGGSKPARPRAAATATTARGGQVILVAVEPRSKHFVAERTTSTVSWYDAYSTRAAAI
ncbi:hypothetical protein MRX96_040854 [Rhipicephalus microplus]